MRLHGRDLSADEARGFVNNTHALVELRQMELQDGNERGSRAIQGRTAGGLDFLCLVDRALDIGEVTLAGMPLTWRACTGFTAPWFYDPAPGGFDRSAAGGLFMTAGLDHVMDSATEFEPAYAYSFGGERFYPLHGRIAHSPGRILELYEGWSDDNPVLRIVGTTYQSSVFGEHFELHRTIEAEIGRPRLRVTDVVTNYAGTAAPHMMHYHCNFGFPLMEPDTRVFCNPVVSTEGAEWNNAGEIPLSPIGPPRRNNEEQVFSHVVTGNDDGTAHAGVWNPREQLAFGLTYPADLLPSLLEWRVQRAGFYALGLEPSMGWFPGGRERARAEGRIKTLEPGESVTYEMSWKAESLDSVEAVPELWPGAVVGPSR